MLENPISSESQEKTRYRFWERIEEREGAVLRGDENWKGSAVAKRGRTRTQRRST